MGAGNNKDIITTQDPKQKALQYVDKKIKSYKHDANFHGIAYFISQILAVSLSAITPVLIISNIPKVWQATIPAIASIASGLSIYKWRESWASCAITAAKLDAEKTKFNVDTVSDVENIKKFLDDINAIEEEHLKTWSGEKTTAYWQINRAKTGSDQPEISPQEKT